jgi:hypothetical protein
LNLELCVAGLLAQVHWDVMTSFCKLISGSAMTHLADVVHIMEVLKEECQYEEAARSCLLTGINAVLVNLLGQERRSLNRVVHRDGMHKKTKKPIVPGQV